MKTFRRGIEFDSGHMLCWYDPVDLKQNRQVGFEVWDLPEGKYYFVLFGTFGMYWRKPCNNK